MLDVKQALKISENSVDAIINALETGIRKNAELGKYEYSTILDADDSIIDVVEKTLRKSGYLVKTESTFGYDCMWRHRLHVCWRKDSIAEEWRV